jgi:hypothetical protein
MVASRPAGHDLAPDVPRELPVVDAAGTPRTIGEAYGRALRPLVERHLDRWMGAIAARHGDAEQAIARFVGGGRFEDAAARWAPDLVEEIDGLAAGAAIERNAAWLLQLMDESWQQAGLFGGEHCTTFGAVEGFRSWLGQTMDLEGFRDGTQAVLRLAPTGRPAQLIVTMAGCIGLLGISAAGFAICVNALAQVPTSPSGLPVALALRTALAQGSLDEAEELLREVPHATGQHYLLGNERRMISLECSAVAVVTSLPGARKVWHANHPMVGYVPTDDDADSDERAEAARRILSRVSFGRSRAMELLEHPPICRPWIDDGEQFTFAATIVEQRPSVRPALLVTNGPPTRGAWRKVPWPGDGPPATHPI